MGLPSITIKFQAAAKEVSRRGGQGTVGLIIKDSASVSTNPLVLMSASDIPSTLSESNRKYIAQAFVGNVNRPSRVYVYVLAAAAASYETALAAFAKLDLDWVAGDPEATETLAGEIKTWVGTQRGSYDSVVKAVLPETEADNEAIVDFDASGILVGGSTYAAAAYCARIAGLIAGTPLWESTSYVALPEVDDVTRKTRAALDAEVDAGKFVLLFDGTKVKTGRGVTSLTTTTSKPALLKKIKIVETLDLIKRDLRLLVEDEYIGKYANSYDNKCVLLTAVKSYLTELEGEGILQSGKSTVQIDLAAQEAYLKSQGVDVSKMTEAEIKNADTGSKVFLLATIRILDAIEDVEITVDYTEV